jgi:hypothetical protein
MTTPLVDIWTCRVYMSAYTICTFLYNVFIYFQCSKNVQDAPPMVLGTVRYDRTVVVLLHKPFSSWLSTFCNSVSISRTVPTLPWASQTLQHIPTIRFTFFKLAYYFLFLFSTECQLWIFHLDCTRCCGFTFLTHFDNKSQCCWRGNYICCVIISLA